MNISLKTLLISAFMIFFISIGYTYGQSENEKIDKLIEQKRYYNKKNKVAGGFKIQIYNGNETQANKIKREFEALFPEYSTTIKYKSPEWKTQVGPFKTRLEADRTLLEIKEGYAGAIVIEDK
jgi:hypothetical protein